MLSFEEYTRLSQKAGNLRVDSIRSRTFTNWYLKNSMRGSGKNEENSIGKSPGKKKNHLSDFAYTYTVS